MPLLSELEYAAFLSYVPRPATDAGKASKQWMYHLKNDHLFGHPPKSMSTLVAQRLAETLITLPFRDLLDGTALAVPIPKSSLMRPGSLWVPLLLCKALKEAGLVAEVLDCLRRQHAVRKSATSAPSERATAGIHYESMSVEKALVPPTASLLLVDDVITRGATMLGCAQRLAEAFPQAQISGFAAMRTVSKEADFVALSAPCRGKVTLQDGNSYRHP
jgi:hypothetical protein